MKNKLLRSSWDLLMIPVALMAFASAMNQFINEHHYMIPTAHLVPCVLAANLSRRGFKGERWAKYVLFWFGFLMCCMTFMGFFEAQRPKVIFGDFFLPVWGVLFLVVTWLTWQYKKANDLSL